MIPKLGRPFAPLMERIKAMLPHGKETLAGVRIDGNRSIKGAYPAYVSLSIGVAFQDNAKRYHDRGVYLTLTPSEAYEMAQALRDFAEYAEDRKGEK